MHDLAVVGVKALAGGTLVVAFAVLGHVLRPKWFAGLFSAAPSVALASLIVTVADKGHHDAAASALGMIFGAFGFVVFALCVRALLGRMHAVAASAISCAVWLAVAVGSYAAALP